MHVQVSFEDVFEKDQRPSSSFALSIRAAINPRACSSLCSNGSLVVQTNRQMKLALSLLGLAVVSAKTGSANLKDLSREEKRRTIRGWQQRGLGSGSGVRPLQPGGSGGTGTGGGGGNNAGSGGGNGTSEL